MNHLPAQNEKLARSDTGIPTKRTSLMHARFQAYETFAEYSNNVTDCHKRYLPFSFVDKVELFLADVM
jgi:hypothetical protein